MAGQQGQQWSRSMTRQQRDEIALTKIEQLLDNQIDGKVRLSPEKLRAVEMRYAKLRPMLSAVEQTTINPDDKLTESDLEARIQALFLAHPDLVQRVQGAIAKAQGGITGAQMSTPAESDGKQSKNVA